MKTTATLLALLLSATGTTWASGLSIDSVDVSDITPTKVETAEITKIKVQGPTDAFDVMVKATTSVDTSTLNQNYDGRS